MPLWVQAWVFVPALTVLLCVGLGLLAQQLTRTTLSRPLVLSLGVSALVVLSTLFTAFPAIASLASTLVLVLALVGWAWGGVSFLGGVRATWAWASAAVAFLVYGLPILLGGVLTWGGFIKLDDTADWMTFAEHLVTHGYTTLGLGTSTADTLVLVNFNQGYPVGAFAPLGVVSHLVGVQSVWALSPYMATLGALLACGVCALLEGLVRSDLWRAVVAAVAASSTLLLGYVMWGGLKEITLAALLASASAVLSRWRSDTRPMLAQAALFAVPAAAIAVVFGVAAAVYLAPLVLAELVVAWASYGFVRLLAMAGVFLATFGVLGLPTWMLARTQLSSGATAGLATSTNDIGNLFRPLRFQQVAGVWLAGDFRVDPQDLGLTWLLLVVVAVAAVGAVVVALLRREVALPVYAITSLVVAGASVFGNAWLEGKVLAAASPAVLAAGVAGCALLAESGRRFEGWAVTAVVSAGLLASNVMVYREVWLAPSARMQELAAIGQGDYPKPALILEYSAIGARYLLAPLDAQGAGELRHDLIPLYTGQGLDKGAYADIDDYPVPSLAPFQTLVLRTDLNGSRPPSLYTLATPGTWYDVWTQDASAAPILRHWPLGTASDPAAPAPCSTVRAAATAAGPSGRVAIAERAPLVTVSLSDATLPSGWVAGGAAGAVDVSRPGTVTTSFSVPTSGTYLASIGQSFWGTVTVNVDGRDVYSAWGQLNWSPYANPMPPLQLTAGAHTMTVTYSQGWRPGEGFTPSTVGPVLLSQTGPDVKVTSVPSSQATSLCGVRADWVEALSG
jgi:hypothetical protein